MGGGSCSDADHGDHEVVECCDEEVASVCSVAGFDVEEFEVPGFGGDPSGAFSDGVEEAEHGGAVFVCCGDDGGVVECVAGGEFGGVADDECAGCVEGGGGVRVCECAKWPPFCVVSGGDGVCVGDDGDVGAECGLGVVVLAE